MSQRPQSIIYLPLIAKERVLGIITIQSFEKHAYTEHHLNVLQSLASYTAIALDNANAYRQLNEHEVEIRRLFEEAQQARAIAEEADAAKSAFLSTVSHELRTPLTSVLGFAKIIKKRLEDRIFPLVPKDDRKVVSTIQQVEDNLKVVVSEGERLTKLIDDVLDLAKIEAGKLEWHMESVTMAEIIDRATAATSSLFDQKGLRLEKQIAPDLPAVTGDQDRLIQVVINLISNAVKFTDAGTITCRATRRGGELVVCGHRHRHGHRAVGSAEGVRALQAGRRHADRQAEGHGPGPAHLQGDRRAPRRPHLGGERDRARQHVLLLAARHRRAALAWRGRGSSGGAGRAHPPAARAGDRHDAAHLESSAAHSGRRRRPEYPRAAVAGVRRGGLPGAARQQRPRGRRLRAARAPRSRSCST